MGMRATHFLKISLVLAFAIWLADALCRTEPPRQAWASLAAQWGRAEAGWLWAAVLLMPANWAAEAKKWGLLLGSASRVPFWLCLRSVLAGVSSSVFTPNRIGEVAGRLLVLPPALRWWAAVAQGLSMVSQLWVVLAAGAAGLWGLWVARFSPPLHWAAGAGCLGGGGLALLLWGYLGLAQADFERSAAARNLRLWLAWAYEETAGAWPRLRPALAWMKHRARAMRAGARQLSTCSVPLLSRALVWAALRYGIYSLQYFCLLRFAGVAVGVAEGFSGIFTLFLLQAGLPLPPVLGLLARGGLAVQMWAFFGASEMNSLAATGLLWIINLILPALVGTFFLLSVNRRKPHHHHPAHD